jgi:putative Mg2+ transporter-C (MgtC) family protein
MMNWLQEAGATIVRDFSDLAEAANVAKVVVRLLVAAILGGLIGFERENAGKSAGMRTHMLVAMGAAIFVMVPQLLGAEGADISRVVQGLVAGVGFLGAGAIMNKGDDARGLTTAASIWLTAAVGMAAGLGREALAVVSTLLALVVLAVIPKIALNFQKPSNGSPTTTKESSAEKKDS